MERLWSTWRAGYINEYATKKRRGCFICYAARHPREERAYVLQKTPQAITMLNLYPYNPGHLLVAPIRHMPDVSALSKEEEVALFEMAKLWMDAIKKTMGPDGFNFGLNLGKSAGAGLETHIHFHVVPRWTGDTSLMGVLADTRVISISLGEVYEKLMNAVKKV